MPKTKGKDKFTHQMTANEWVLAAKAWQQIMNAPGRPHAHFDRFVGSLRTRDGIGDGIGYVTEDAYNKIKMLNSRHAYALLKAFKARTGYKKEIP